ncbi:MAG: threonine dehydratase [Anaerolineae bacterium]|nr:threonine dehydratase [Anaerolineae bacterium]MCB9104392.1 threonine dehydratase [Anaerolineales bacterium]
MTEQPMPTLHDIIAARPNVYRYLKPTPLYHYSGLSELVGAQVWVKHENHQPVGAFKVRGGLNLAANLTEAEREAGLFTASTGNHGQSIAFSARAYGIKATIAVPEGANPGKVAAMRGLGAEVVFHGHDFDTAREWIMGEAEAHGGRFIGPTEELLICGVGTYALEIVEELPEVDTIIVPVGAGSGACGVSIVAKSINPKIEVIAVQSAQAPSMQRSWQRGELVTAEMNTFAEGIATRVPFQNTQRIMRQYLDDFVLVDDADIKHAVGLLLEHTRNLAEGAGAAPLAAALQMKDRLVGKQVVLILSGGNLSMEKLKGILSTYETN